MASSGAAKKPKPLYLTIGAPGPKSKAMAASNLWPEKGAAGTSASQPVTAAPSLEPNPAGRPKSNLGQYLIKADPESTSGFEMLNSTPDILDRVDQHLKAFQLPPSLQPKYLRRPSVMDTNRGKNISKGHRNPRGAW